MTTCQSDNAIRQLTAWQYFSASQRHSICAKCSGTSNKTSSRGGSGAVLEQVPGSRSWSKVPKEVGGTRASFGAGSGARARCGGGCRGSVTCRVGTCSGTCFETSSGTRSPQRSRTCSGTSSGICSGTYSGTCSDLLRSLYYG